MNVDIQAELDADGGAIAIVGAHVLTSQGEGAFVQLRQGSGGNGLTLHSEPLQIADDAESIVLYAAVTGTSGYAVFDNVRIGSATGATSLMAASLGGELTASITVDATVERRAVPGTLFGINVEWINNGQGLWYEAEDALHPEALELSRELGASLLRFPGGVFSDYYHWRDGTGPRAERPTRAHFPNGPVSANNFGTDELLELATQMDADVLITANAGTGTAQEAADWLRYIRQNTTDTKSQHWEIGNELYMEGDLSGVDISAREYARRFEDFAVALRAVDDSIKLGAIGGLNQGRYSFVKSENWTRDVLRRVATQMDFLAVHNAYAPVLVGRDDDADPHAVYMAMLAAPYNFSANLDRLDALLEEHEDPDNPISIAITEWGPLFHFEPSSPWVDHVKTLGSSLLVGSTLHTFLAHPRVEIATAFKLMDYGFMGWIGLDGSRYKATAPYLAFQLYTPTIDGKVLATTTESPTFDTRAIGTVDAVRDAALLDALSVRQGRDLYVYAINKSSTSTIKTSFQLDGADQFSAVAIDTLAGAGLDAHTGTAPPQFPGVEWADQVSLGNMESGGDADIGLTSVQLDASDLEWSAGRGDYTFPPLSITRLRFVNAFGDD